MQVILLHGNSSSSRSWQWLLESESLRGHELVPLDLPGHGGGPYDSSPNYSLRGLATTLTRFVHTSAPVPRVVVGWSLGGHVALEAAATVPQLRGLMLIGAPPTGFPASGFLSMPTASMSRYPLPEHVREHIEGLCRDSSKRMVFEQDFAVTDPRVREDLARCIASGDFADEVDIIRGSLPVAAVMGEHDHLIDLRYLQELPWGNLWEHQVHLVAGAMHAPQCDAPEAVAKLISRFVSHLHHG